MTAASEPQPTDTDNDDVGGSSTSTASEEKSGAMHDADVANGENPAE